jgi:hypothetical protein
MTDPTRPDPGDGNDAATRRGQPPRMPGWVKWPGIVLIVLALVFLALRFVGVEHGPGLHGPGGDASTAPQMPSDHTPAGGHG